MEDVHALYLFLFFAILCIIAFLWSWKKRGEKDYMDMEGMYVANQGG